MEANTVSSLKEAAYSGEFKCGVEKCGQKIANDVGGG